MVTNFEARKHGPDGSLLMPLTHSSSSLTPSLTPLPDRSTTFVFAGTLLSRPTSTHTSTLPSDPSSTHTSTLPSDPSGTLFPSHTSTHTNTILPPSTSLSLTGGSSTSNQTRIIAGVITSVTVTIILGLIVFCVLRRKCRDRFTRSVSNYGGLTSSDVISQRMPQPTRSSTTPQPFLDFPAMQDSSQSKGIDTDHARGSFTRKNQADIEQVVDPFRDLILAEDNPSNNVNEDQRLKDTLDRLQALAGRFEREMSQLGALTRPRQASTEGFPVLEETRNITDPMIPYDSSHNIARGPSVGSASSPPSYHSLC